MTAADSPPTLDDSAVARDIAKVDPMAAWREKGRAEMMRGGAVTEVTVKIDTAELTRISDGQLALFWHVAQHNPVSLNDKAAGDLVEEIGREIIRRWLGGAKPELYRHQGRHYYWGQLSRFAKWNGEAWQATPETLATAIAESGLAPEDLAKALADAGLSAEVLTLLKDGAPRG